MTTCPLVFARTVATARSPRARAGEGGRGGVLAGFAGGSQGGANRVLVRDCWGAVALYASVGSVYDET
jgi:hypothetical protein